MPSDHAQEIKHALHDPGEVLTRLGLLTHRGTYTKQARGFIILCPVHKEKTPSCSVQRVGEVVMWRCHGCGEGGDVLTLIAAVNGLSTRRDFHQVLIIAAEIAGLHGLVRELETGVEDKDRTRVQPPRLAPVPDRDYPPQAEVDAVWNSCDRVTADEEVSMWLSSRGMDPDLVEAGDLARALPPDAALPFWASWRRQSWLTLGHRVIIPMRDTSGRIRSIRAGRMADGESPKRLPPGGYKAAGLVMADELATALLAGTRIPERAVFTEGEPDFLCMATVRHRVPTATFGIVGGSWTPEFAMRFPEGCGVEVILWTDRDRAGDKYASEIAPWLVQRGCFVRRDGRKAA